MNKDRSRLSAIILIAAILLSSCKGAPVKSGARSEAQGLQFLKEGTMDYGLFIPARRETAQQYPLVMYLHGYTEKPLVNRPWQIHELQRIEPCFVFIPTCTDAEGASAWGGTYDAELRPAMKTALAILDRLMKEYPVDPQRVYVYGGSMGGEGVFMLLARQPERFAAAVAVAGYTLVKDADQMARTPLWILDGSKDVFIDANVTNVTEASRNIFAAIKAAGGKQVCYTEYPGADHMTIWGLVYKEPGLLNWLLEHRRQ